MSVKTGQRLTDEEEFALFGLALADPEVFLSVKTIKGEFSNGALDEVFKLAAEEAEKLERPLTQTELEERVRAKFGASSGGHLATIKRALEAAGKVGEDFLIPRLSDWAKTQVFKKYSERVTQSFRTNDVDETTQLWIEAAMELESIQANIGLGRDTLQPSPDRMFNEAESRRQDASKGHLEYGVSFLDDCLGGLFRKQFVIVGAETGVGKTEFARLVAAHNAKKKKRVHAYFLEAEENEIERRIKFPLLLQRYARDGAQVDPRKMNYVEWCAGRCAVLDKFSEEIEMVYKAEYSTLYTYYRQRSGFSADSLKREFLKARGTADLFVIDHLQYLDIASEKHEVQAVTDLLMTMRDLTLWSGIPILCICHLKKTGRSTGLVPNLDDLYGTGNVTKIATTCITLAPFRDTANIGGGPEGGLATLIQAQKYRLEGARTRVAGLCWYKPEEGCYGNQYCISDLGYAKTKWAATQVPVWWPEEGVGRNVTMFEEGGLDK